MRDGGRSAPPLGVSTVLNLTCWVSNYAQLDTPQACRAVCDGVEEECPVHHKPSTLNPQPSTLNPRP